MACPDSGVLLDLSLGRLAAGAMKPVRAHAAACLPCGRELGSLEGTLSAVRAVPAAAPGPGFLDRVRREVEVIRRAEREAAAAEHLIRSKPWVRRPWIPAAAAAALLASVSGGLWWSLAGRAPLPPEAAHPGVRTAERGVLPLPSPVPEPSPALPEPDLPVDPATEAVPDPVPPDAAETGPSLPEPLIPDPPAPTPESAPAVETVDTPREHPPVLPGPSRLRSGAPAGRAWLASRQNPDGSWGELVAEENLASRIQVTSLAVLAMTEGEADPTCLSCLDLALGFLEANQDPKGMVGPACDKRALVQAMATAALASGSRVRPGHGGALGRAAQALLRCRSADGWARDGSQGPVHAVATAWSAAALLRARAADPSIPEDWKAKAAEACRRLVDPRKGSAGLLNRGDDWAATVAVGAVLAGASRTEEARRLRDAAVRGTPERLSCESMDRSDPESLVLLCLWARSDPKAFPAFPSELRRALVRWAPEPSADPPAWQALRAGPWDGLSGEAYATAMGTWLLELAPKARR